MQNKSISRTFWEGTFWTSFFGIGTKIIAMISAIFVLRTLSIYEYGLSELVMSLVSLLGIFMLPGMMQTMVADVSNCVGNKEYGRAKEIAFNFFIFLFILCSVAFLILFIGSFITTRFVTVNVSNSVRIASFIFLLTPFGGFMSLIFSVTKNFKAQGINSFFNELFRFVIIILLFNFSSLKLEAVFFASVIGQFLSLIICVPLLVRSYELFQGVKRIKTMPFYESFVHHGKWSVFSSYLNSFGQNMRLWMIKFYLGTSAVSIFSMAYTLFSHTQSIISFSSILQPILSERSGDKDLINNIVNKAIKYQILIFVMVGSLCFFVVPILATILFPKYIESLPLYRIILLSMIPSSFAIIFTPMFHAKKEQKSLFWAIAFKDSLIVLFSVMFLPVFGIIGCALEHIATSTFFVFERYRILKKKYDGFRIRINDFITYDDLDRKLVKKILLKFKSSM